ncbi:SWI/SNF-related matrix-associated actin-dependent regulator of chromatin subfamily A containing DEAD/H box 1A isoform X2 [Corythoichthys intestinalis]|uniref:SWI/SNF-related matrix-associated actin-dependent regulator of chromatin subfamily A containing DEAD/H box 1A isoform X2 n=1 Tax=Corythoichthys intestinalis TaxID=161448 RepID=UPI0025A4D0DA|nr:SWI/SNF-related matrix-associated actin-dependent regulator of chromatin subfamily A containing DEAD/H box 1A isoform X2 [Corythoichthys intestinalis]
MSQFNLERFRFQKSFTCKGQNTRSESEKENKPAQMKSTKSHLSTSYSQGVIFEDSDDDKPPRKKSFSKKSRDAVIKPSTHVIKDEREEKKSQESKLAELFPNLSRKKLSEVVGSTSTLDGAVATCLLISEDKDKDCVGKRKEDLSDSSRTIGETRLDRKRKQTEVVGSASTVDGVDSSVPLIQNDGSDFVQKRNSDVSFNSLECSETQPYKRIKQIVVSDDSTEDSEDEPSWEKQEAMVQKLQKKFANQFAKEELRSVLQEHSWDVVEARHALKMFSEQDDSCLSKDAPKISQHTKSEEKSLKEQSKLHQFVFSDKKIDAKVDTHKDLSDTQNSSDATVDSDDYAAEENVKHSNSILSSWITKDMLPVMKTTYQKPSCSSTSLSSGKTLSSFDSGTSLAKKRAKERKQKARAVEESMSSGDDDDDDDDDESASSSDFDNYDDALAKIDGVKGEVLKFFQEATIDELTLISKCSIKKASKIIELRPFKNWLSLLNVMQKINGLSEDLLVDCRTVLKERTIVRRLMSKCETISSLMVKQVTEVMRAGSGTMQQPSLLNSQFKLKPHQLIGLKWLQLLHEHNLSGILADEMGLGKTIQAIAFLAHLFLKGLEGPHLIIVPGSTLDNWVRELKKWCPILKVLVYCGSMEDRSYLKHDILNNEVDFNILVTTYNFAIGNNNDRSLFRKLRVTYAIFDEGHMLKNMNSLRYRNLMSINAKHRLLLTGTPLQNNLLELMSLLNFIMPSMFSSSTVQLSKMFSMKSREEQSQFEKDRISEAKRIMKPFILRRVKNEVLQQLPDKKEKVEYCSMSEKQQVLYHTLLKNLKASTTGENRQMCNVVMQLRKMANHPLLHRQYYTTEKLKAMSKLMLKEPTHHDASAELIQEDMEVMSDFELHCLCQKYTSISSYQLENSLLFDSGKFRWLTEELASHKDKGDKVVLFSQFTMMLDIVEVLMKHLNHHYIRLDGSTPIADRMALIDEFNNNSNVFVFLLSTRAGGLGINLTSANIVILHDIDWNPYNDKQAEDRCHRLGQTRTVQVIKLISQDSIEDGILQLSQKKLKLEQDMTAAEQCGEGTMPEDMASLLKASLGL